MKNIDILCMMMVLIFLNVGKIVKLVNVVLHKCAEDQFPLDPAAESMLSPASNVGVNKCMMNDE